MLLTVPGGAAVEGVMVRLLTICPLAEKIAWRAFAAEGGVASAGRLARSRFTGSKEEEEEEEASSVPV